MGTVSDLRQAAKWVSEVADLCSESRFVGPYRRLHEAAESVGQAWCGSWLPRTANLYDRNLKAVPLRLRLIAGSGTDHLPAALQLRCRAWTSQQIRDAIRFKAGEQDLRELRDCAVSAAAALQDSRAVFLAAIDRISNDVRLAELRTAAQAVSARDEATILASWRPPYMRTPQMAQAAPPPPHLCELASLEALLEPFHGLERIGLLMLEAAAMLDKQAPRPARTATWPAAHWSPHPAALR